jgi:hypothetical protein
MSKDESLVVHKTHRSRISQLVIMLNLLLLFLIVATNYRPILEPGSPPIPAAVNEDRSGCVVSAPPEDPRFDLSFYRKYCDAGGIPIISSEKVDDLALQQAYYLIMNILAPLPDVRRALVENGVYFAIIGRFEKLSALPEYTFEDPDYWNQRARGLGGSKHVPVTSGGEENLLCLSWERYYGESIPLHEFAHTIHLAGLVDTQLAFNIRLWWLYWRSLGEGLWEDTYAGENVQEYWAEGIQTYFNTNLENDRGVHNHVNTRAELAEYDPRLFEFIDEIFGGFEWTPTCPE